MIYVYYYLFPVMWIVFLVYWNAVAMNAKTTERMEPTSSRVIRAVVFLAAIALLSLPHIPLPWLYRPLYPPSAASFWAGAAITLAGLLFAVWARVYLGRNWSRSVTVKQDHELIVGGPYALVRHPIYTGILTGFVGTVIALAQVRGIVALVMIFLVLWAKLRLEERWMREHFGEQYSTYSKRVAALVPFVL